MRRADWSALMGGANECWNSGRLFLVALLASSGETKTPYRLAVRRRAVLLGLQVYWPIDAFPRADAGALANVTTGLSFWCCRACSGERYCWAKG